MRNMMGVLAGASMLAVCGLILGMMPQNAAVSPARPAGSGANTSQPRPELANYSLVDLQLPDALEGESLLSVNLGGTSYDLDLTPHSLRADDFRLLVQGADGRLVEQPAPPPATFRGVVSGDPGSYIRGSLRDGLMTASIHLSDGTTWNIQPAVELFPSAGLAHIVYNQHDVIPVFQGRCGTTPDMVSQNPATPSEPGEEEGGIAGTGLRTCEMALDCDREFYQLNGSTVPNTMFDCENVFNNIEAIYERDVDITFDITVIVVRTAEPDPYSSSDPNTLLNQFQGEWNLNMQAIRRDLAELMTGRTMTNNVLGIAWNSAVCDSVSSGFGYSVVQSRFSPLMTNRACVSAHEIGHNFSATHCDASPPCYIMCATLGECQHNCTAFSQNSIDEITAYRNTRTCLANLADPIVPPFTETFPTLSISQASWTYNNGAVASSSALGEPSGAVSLQLNASGSQDYRDDEIRTNFIQLAGVTSPEVSYWVEHRGVESGEQLVVDYWGSNLRWNELNRITSDGVDQSSFEQFTHTVPPNGRHNEFRLRFRVEVNESNDTWYVDDVYVGASLQTLNISSTGVNGVPITVTPADTNGATDGNTPFARVYTSGQLVTVTAPASFSGADFVNWTVNSINLTPGQLAATFTVSAASTAVANYDAVQTATYTVNSSPVGGAQIGVSPPDNGAQGNGTTPLTRTYTAGTPVTFTAQHLFQVGNVVYVFERWQVDSVNQPDGQLVLQRSAGSNETLNASYVLRGDMNGDGVTDNSDIDAFVLALLDPAAYQSAYPGLNPLLRGDCNDDGTFDNSDIDGFVALLL